MGEKRFKRLGKETFFGDFVYDRAVAQNHFLRQLDAVIDWSAFGARLLQLYAGGAEEGRPPYAPVVILKMLLLAYLYNLSERQTEAYVNDSLSAKWFLGLAVDEPAPDHSTLTAFKRRIVERGQEGCLQALLEEVVRMAQARGIRFGSLQIVDSTHSQADVNIQKEARRQEAGKPARDAEARWGVKQGRRGRDAQVERFYGYKAHVSLNAEAEMITSVVVTSGNATDGKQLAKLVERDRRQELAVATYAADRGYDDGENHFLLASAGLHSAIRLKRQRTEKKDAHKEVWVALKATPEYRAGQAVRYKIERKFGEAKVYHGLRRCRYLGRLRYALQVYLTAIVLNLKRMVKLLTGVAFKGRARLAA